MKKVCLTDTQRQLLEDLWFIYGNYGSKSTMGNHKFIQNLLEDSEDHRDFYKIDLTDDCINAVDKILNCL